MAVNKVVYNGKVLIDLTGITVTPDTLAEGYTAIDATGNLIEGTAKSEGGSFDLTPAICGEAICGLTVCGVI